MHAALYPLVKWARKNDACFNTTQSRIDHIRARNIYHTRKMGGYTLECNDIIKDHEREVPEQQCS